MAFQITSHQSIHLLGDYSLIAKEYALPGLAGIFFSNNGLDLKQFKSPNPGSDVARWSISALPRPIRSEAAASAAEWWRHPSPRRHAQRRLRREHLRPPAGRRSGRLGHRQDGRPLRVDLPGAEESGSGQRSPGPRVGAGVRCPVAAIG